jgi:hypothetical protein
VRRLPPQRAGCAAPRCHDLTPAPPRGPRIDALCRCTAPHPAPFWRARRRARAAVSCSRRPFCSMVG